MLKFSPEPRKDADVLTVSVVVATPALGVTVGGLKAQVIPAICGHENVTGSTNPPVGVTVRLNEADCPAATVAVSGAAPSEKSLLTMLMEAAAEVLPAN